MITAELEVKPPGSTPFRVPIDPVPFLIGRSPDNHLVLRDNRASRSHASIRREGEDYIVEDAGSRNGIEVNGAKVDKHSLRDGDVIRFGIDDSYELVFRTSPETLPTQPHHGGLRKLRSMLEMARSLAGALSLDHVLTAVVDAALEIAHCERGFLLMVSKDGLQTRVSREAGGKSLTSDVDIPKTLLANALRTRSELLTMRIDPESAGLDSSLARLSLRSVVCVPLLKVRAGDLSETSIVGTIADTVGLLYLDSKRNQAELTSTNRDLLQSLAIEASFIMENARLLEEERKKQHFEQELQIARAIQKDLLPDAQQFPGSGWLSAAGLSVPSRQVGGDYFDLVGVDADRFDVVVSDVSGKGVSSALLAGLLQGAFIMSTAEQVPPSVVFSRLNNFLLGRTSGEKYATMFLASVHRDGAMRWANAGHCAPLLLRKSGAVLELTPTGMPVGMLEEAVWRNAQTTLEPGDLLVFYTDGVTDATSPEKLMYGLDRLVALVLANRMLTPPELTDCVHRDIAAFTGEAVQRDDLTLLVLRYLPD